VTSESRCRRVTVNSPQHTADRGRRKQTGRRETRESVYAVTSLDAHQAAPADLAAAIRGHWGVENMDEIKERLTRIEDENKRLVQLLTALDPERVRTLRLKPLRLATCPLL
jgi:hypothetical protein